MQTINIHDAKTHLSKLIQQAAQGQPFIIAKAGKPMVKVVPLQPAELPTKRRLGFMTGTVHIPDDFDQMNRAEIERLFGGEE